MGKFWDKYLKVHSFVFASTFGLGIAAFFLGVTSFGVLKGLSVENILVWRAAFLAFIISLAWLQGINAPMYCSFSPLIAGLMSTLMLNLVMIYSMNYFELASQVFPYILVMICINVLVASCSYKLVLSSKDFEAKLSPQEMLMFMVSSTPMYLAGAFILIWFIVGLFAKAV